MIENAIRIDCESCGLTRYFPQGTTWGDGTCPNCSQALWASSPWGPNSTVPRMRQTVKFATPLPVALAMLRKDIERAKTLLTIAPTLLAELEVALWNQGEGEQPESAAKCRVTLGQEATS